MKPASWNRSTLVSVVACVLAACSDDNSTPPPAVDPTPAPVTDAGTPPDAAAPDAAPDVVDAGPTYAGFAFAATNAATGNAVVRYGRSSDGKLTTIETVTTGANGVGSHVVVAGAPTPEAVDPLFSDDSLVISSDHKFLFVVNAGSDSVTSFSIDAGDGHLVRVGTYPTGGTFPTSLALHGKNLYVSHARANTDGKQLFGFTVGTNGSLTAITGASYAPTGATTVTHTLFSPNGSLLAMIELMTGMIDVYPVTADGSLGTPVVTASAAPGPFGAEFVSDTLLLVSEVHPGAANAGSVSSYSVASTGALTAISAGVSNQQNATCWLTVSKDKHSVWAGNTTSSNVSGYHLADDGTLTLAAASVASQAPGTATDFLGNPSGGPVDAFVSADGQFFYQQWSGLGLVTAYRIGADGALTPVAGGDGKDLPLIGAEGLAGF